MVQTELVRVRGTLAHGCGVDVAASFYRRALSYLVVLVQDGLRDDEAHNGADKLVEVRNEVELSLRSCSRPQAHAVEPAWGRAWWHRWRRRYGRRRTRRARLPPVAQREVAARPAVPVRSGAAAAVKQAVLHTRAPAYEVAQRVTQPAGQLCHVGCAAARRLHNARCTALSAAAVATRGGRGHTRGAHEPDRRRASAPHATATTQVLVRVRRRVLKAACGTGRRRRSYRASCREWARVNARARRRLGSQARRHAVGRAASAFVAIWVDRISRRAGDTGAGAVATTLFLVECLGWAAHAAATCRVEARCP
eukprot:IDg14933t1